MKIINVKHGRGKDIYTVSVLHYENTPFNNESIINLCDPNNFGGFVVVDRTGTLLEVTVYTD